MVEEIDVGGSLYREVRAPIRTIMEHLLKLEHSAATEPRAGWERTIRRQRADLPEDLSAYGEHAAADALPTTGP